MKLTWRSLKRAPMFTLTVLATLGVGIGANTAIFSVVYGMLLRPFPYHDPERLVKINMYPLRNPKNEFSVSLKDMEDFQQQARLFESFGGYTPSRVNLVSDGPAAPLVQTLITPGLLPTLGVAPVLGRNFLPDEDRPGGDINKAILSHSLWMSRFGGDPKIVGKSIRTAMTTYTVAGVMPPGFAFPARTDLWVTVESGLALRKDTRRRDSRGAQIVARLRPGVTLAAAQAEIESIGRELQRLYPKTHSEMLHRVQSLRDAETKQLRPYLALLTVAVALVLLICCANVANLMLARGARLEREMTIRAALGASRRTLVARLLTESLVLSLSGGLLGLMLASLLVASIPRLIPQELPVWMRIELDPAALTFTAAVSLLAGLLFGVAPAFRSARVNLNEVLKEGATGSGRSSLMRRALVTAEVALSVLLLVSAALLMKSFQNLLEVDPGFAPERVITVSMSPYRPGTNAERIDQVCQYYREVIRRLEELPGVVAVGGTDNFPFTGVRTERSTLNIEGKGDTAEESRIRAPANFIDITPRYFEAMNIPLLEGRTFNENDTQKAPQVIILSQRAAKAIFPGRTALGNEVRAGTPGHWDPWATVVGIVGNVK
ncbi:MAG TPA: ADOP family duplicated permease, partial [Hyphomonadaceae bacterium]